MRNSKERPKFILTSCISISLCIILTLSCTVLGGALSWGYTYFYVTPMYQSSAQVYISNNGLSADKDSLTSADLSAAVQLTKTYIILAESDTILSQVTENLDNDYTLSELRSAVSVNQIKDTVMIEITATHKDPYKAQLIANKVADILCRRGPDIISGSSAAIIETAHVPTSPITPNYANNLLAGIGIGLASGLLLSLPIVVISLILIAYFKRK